MIPHSRPFSAPPALAALPILCLALYFGLGLLWAGPAAAQSGAAGLRGLPDASEVPPNARSTTERSRVRIWQHVCERMRLRVDNQNFALFGLSRPTQLMAESGASRWQCFHGATERPGGAAGPRRYYREQLTIRTPATMFQAVTEWAADDRARWRMAPFDIERAATGMVDTLRHMGWMEEGNWLTDPARRSEPRLYLNIPRDLVGTTLVEAARARGDVEIDVGKGYGPYFHFAFTPPRVGARCVIAANYGLSGPETLDPARDPDAPAAYDYRQILIYCPRGGAPEMGSEAMHSMLAQLAGAVQHEPDVDE